MSELRFPLGLANNFLLAEIHASALNELQRYRCDSFPSVCACVCVCTREDKITHTRAEDHMIRAIEAYLSSIGG